VNEIAGRLGAKPNVAIRLRPDVEADTHHHISTGSAASKFGVPMEAAWAMARRHWPNVSLRGVHVHIGSQLGSPNGTLRAIEAALEFARRASRAGAQIDSLDIGGGFPVAYRDDDAPPDVEAFAAIIAPRLDSWPGRILIEPGRSVVANSGLLLTSVQYNKERIVIVDAGMHTLIRPALYEAHHRVWPVERGGELRRADVAGPICESADFLARDRMLPPMAEGDLLAVLDAGAYGLAMASNYNSRPLPAEVMVDGESYRLIRRRQTPGEMIASEV